MKFKQQKRTFFVYRITDYMILTTPQKSESVVRKSCKNLQEHFSHQLAVGWHVIGEDGKPQITEYPEK